MCMYVHTSVCKFGIHKNSHGLLYRSSIAQLLHYYNIRRLRGLYFISITKNKKGLLHRPTNPSRYYNNLTIINTIVQILRK